MNINRKPQRDAARETPEDYKKRFPMASTRNDELTFPFHPIPMTLIIHRIQGKTIHLEVCLFTRPFEQEEILFKVEEGERSAVVQSISHVLGAENPFEELVVRCHENYVFCAIKHCENTVVKSGSLCSECR